MSDREPVYALFADLTRPESLAELEEFMEAGGLIDRVHRLAEDGTHFVAILAGASGVTVIPLPEFRDLLFLQRTLVQLAVNLGAIRPVPLELGEATHKLLVRDLDMQTLSTGEVAGHA